MDSGKYTTSRAMSVSKRLLGSWIWTQVHFSITDLPFQILYKLSENGLSKPLPLRSYAAKYSDFRLLSNLSFQKHFIKHKIQFVWFGLTEHVSFLMNSDISRGLWNPFCGPRPQLNSQWKPRWLTVVFLGTGSLQQAGQLSWRVTHTVKEQDRVLGPAGGLPTDSISEPSGGQDP